jgi:hypothetical protein
MHGESRPTAEIGFTIFGDPKSLIDSRRTARPTTDILCMDVRRAAIDETVIRGSDMTENFQDRKVESRNAHDSTARAAISAVAVSAVLMITASLALCPSAGFSEPVASESDASERSTQLQEITVSARRREEPLQEGPVALTVVTAAQAAAHDLNNLQDISAEVPTVDFRTGASNKNRDIFIRGIGTITTSPGVEPSVSTIVDGVVFARPGQATLELRRSDRISYRRYHSDFHYSRITEREPQCALSHDEFFAFTHRALARRLRHAILAARLGYVALQGHGPQIRRRLGAGGAGSRILAVRHG